MATFINLTPHTITLNDGRIFPSKGLARISASYTKFDYNNICKQEFGEVEGIPAPAENTIYIVSALVLAATDRKDVVAPATGHPDCIRKDGFIVSVPGFVCK